MRARRLFFFSVDIFALKVKLEDLLSFYLNFATKIDIVLL